MAATAVVGATEKDIATGNIRRFEKLERIAHDVAAKPMATLMNVI